MTVVAEPYLETKPFLLGSERTTKYMMPFKPLHGVADKASVGVLLQDAFHLLTPHRLESCYLVWCFSLDAKLLCLTHHTINKNAHFPCVKFA